MATTAKDLSGSSISSEDNPTTALDPGDLTVRDKLPISESAEGRTLRLLETACRGKVIRLGDRAVAFPSDLQCKYVGVALEDVPAWRARKLAARALDFDQQDEVQDNSPASEDETSSDDDSETEIVEFPRRRPAVEDPDLFRRIGAAKSVAHLERRDELSRPEQALLKALSDVLEDRRPPYVGVPLSVMDRLRERREEDRQNERIGPASLSTYIGVSSFCDYGSDSGATPSRSELAEVAGISTRRLDDQPGRGRGSLPLLRELDLVDWTRRPGRRSEYDRKYDGHELESRVPHWALALLALHPDGDAEAVAVLAALLRFADYDHDGEITALPSDAAVARHALCSPRTVYRRRKLLERLGIIVRDKERSEPQSIVYRTPRSLPESVVNTILDLLENGATPRTRGHGFGGDPTNERASYKSHSQEPRKYYVFSSALSSKTQGTLARAGGRGRPRRTSKESENSVGQRREDSSTTTKDFDDSTSRAESCPADSDQGFDDGSPERGSAAAEEESVPETWEELSDPLYVPPEIPSRPVQVAQTPDGVPIMAWTEETGDGLDIVIVRAGERSANPLPAYMDGLMPSSAFAGDFPTDAAEFFASLPATLGPHPETGRPVKLHVSEHGPYLIHTGHEGEEGYGTVDVPFTHRPLEALRDLSLEDAVRIIEQDRERTRSNSEDDPGPVTTDGSGMWSGLEPATQ